MSVNTLMQLSLRIIAIFVLVLGMIDRFPEWVYWLRNGKGFEGPIQNLSVYMKGIWYPAGFVFVAFILLFSPLLVNVLPAEERLPMKLNAFAILTTSLRVLGWTSVVDPISRILVVKLGWLEYSGIEGFFLQAIIGVVIFWFAPQIARTFFKAELKEPSGLTA